MSTILKTSYCLTQCLHLLLSLNASILKRDIVK